MAFSPEEISPSKVKITGDHISVHLENEEITVLEPEQQGPSRWLQFLGGSRQGDRRCFPSDTSQQIAQIDSPSNKGFWQTLGTSGSGDPTLQVLYHSTLSEKVEHCLGMDARKPVCPTEIKPPKAFLPVGVSELELKEPHATVQK